MSTIIEDYYLCEGIYLKADERKLIDERDNDKELDITNINDKITIFEREVKEWIIHPMWILLKDDITIEGNNNLPHFKYAPFKNAIFVLFGIFSYCEKIQRYRMGIKKSQRNDESTEILSQGIETIFSDLKGTNIRDILKETRNQMMHSGMIGDGVLLNYSYPKTIEYISTTKEIKINPYKILKAIEKDFEDYIQKLKDTEDKKFIENFKKVFNSYYNDEINHLA